MVQGMRFCMYWYRIATHTEEKASLHAKLTLDIVDHKTYHHLMDSEKLMLSIKGLRNTVICVSVNFPTLGCIKLISRDTKIYQFV